MAISVRMDPLLEKELELAAKRRGMNKSQFIIEAVERALGRKDPYQLLLQVRKEFPDTDTADAQSEEQALANLSPHKRALREHLRAKHARELADWEAWNQARANPPAPEAETR